MFYSKMFWKETGGRFLPSLCQLAESTSSNHQQHFSDQARRSTSWPQIWRNWWKPLLLLQCLGPTRVDFVSGGFRDGSRFVQDIRMWRTNWSKMNKGKEKKKEMKPADVSSGLFFDVSFWSSISFQSLRGMWFWNHSVTRLQALVVKLNDHKDTDMQKYMPCQKPCLMMDAFRRKMLIVDVWTWKRPRPSESSDQGFWRENSRMITDEAVPGNDLDVVRVVCWRFEVEEYELQNPDPPTRNPPVFFTQKITKFPQVLSEFCKVPNLAKEAWRWEKQKKTKQTVKVVFFSFFFVSFLKICVFVSFRFSVLLVICFQHFLNRAASQISCWKRVKWKGQKRLIWMSLGIDYPKKGLQKNYIQYILRRCISVYL